MKEQRRQILMYANRHARCILGYSLQTRLTHTDLTEIAFSSCSPEAALASAAGAGGPAAAPPYLSAVPYKPGTS